jgi:hypothetical protein
VNVELLLTCAPASNSLPVFPGNENTFTADIDEPGRMSEIGDVELFFISSTTLVIELLKPEEPYTGIVAK